MNILKKIFLTEGVFVFVIVSLLFLIFSPKAIYPMQGMTIIDPNFNFEIENAEEVLLSFSENFNNPVVLRKGDEITLFPGVYFWKVKSKFRESEVQNFTIQSNVALSLKERNNTIEIRNVGNVELNVSKDSFFSFTIPLGGAVEFEKDSSVYIGAQNE